MTRTRHALALLLAGALASGCSWLGGAERPSETGEAVQWDPAASLTREGEALAVGARLPERAPTYAVAARVEPATGAVSGTVRASLPVGRSADEILFRYFPGLPDFNADATVGRVAVEGRRVEAEVDAAVVRVPLPPEHADRVAVTVPFHYTLPVSRGGGGILDALGGMGSPADIGLLARHERVWNLGHWFPLWIPPGSSADPRPAGFGDIGNAPAALIRLELSVPAAWDVVDGGVRTGDDVAAGRRTVTSEGYGMNDLVVSLVRGYASAERTLEGELAGVVVRAHGPSRSRGELAGVLDEASTSLEVLSSHFVDYPWRELDVVSAPLGAGVAGMEWPGATWIEPALFAGGVPGLGGLDDLLGDAGGLPALDDLLEDLGGGPGGPDLGGLAEDGTLGMIETLRAWTIAHEVGHEWWHVVVGNDSVLAPVVDEPLAQYSACLVLRELADGDAAARDELCATHIRSGYQQMRALGGADAPAAQATDAFDSSLQYSGVVYGKAAAFYLELEELVGREAVASALGGVTERHAFDMLTADQLRAALSREIADPRFDDAWHRWMDGRHGDEDLGATATGTSGSADGLQEELGALLSDPDRDD